MTVVTKLPTSTVNDLTFPWAGPNNILHNNGLVASRKFTVSAFSSVLMAKSFGLSIPSKAVINSVSLKAKWSLSSNNENLSLQMTTDKTPDWYESCSIYNNIPGEQTFDITNELAWTPAALKSIVMKLTFLNDLLGSIGNGTAKVDYCSIIVDYT